MRRWKLQKVGHATAALSLALVASLAVAGCAATDTTTPGGEATGESVPYGASPAEFAAALEDMEPVKLVFQTSSASATGSGGPRAVAFKEYIEEYSGGKIEIEIAWGQAISAVTETDNSIGDGRVDLDQFFAIYEPSEWPANAMLNDITLLSPPGVVDGTLAGGAAMIEYSFRESAFAEEAEAGGIYVSNFLGPSVPPFLMCKEPVTSLADFKGKQIRVSGAVHAAQFSAIGGVPVSMPMTEVYEGLQRGIIDCATAAFPTALINGFLEVAPHVHYSTTLALPAASVGRIHGDRVESLPLAARQLIFDAQYDNLVVGLSTGWDQEIYEGVEQIEAYGGGMLALDGETDAALAKANKDIIADLADKAPFDASSLESDVTALMDKWVAIVHDLGYEQDGTIENFREWYEPGSIDLKPWLDRLYDEVLLEYRPQ